MFSGKLISAEQCYTFGMMVGALGIVFSFIINASLPNISLASLIVGVLLICTSAAGSIYVLYKGQKNLTERRETV